MFSVTPSSGFEPDLKKQTQVPCESVCGDFPAFNQAWFLIHRCADAPLVGPLYLIEDVLKQSSAHCIVYKTGAVLPCELNFMAPFRRIGENAFIRGVCPTKAPNVPLTAYNCFLMCFLNARRLTTNHKKSEKHADANES